MLTADELSAAVAQHGVTFKKPKYYADDKAAAAVCRPAAAVASVSLYSQTGPMASLSVHLTLVRPHRRAHGCRTRTSRTASMPIVCICENARIDLSGLGVRPLGRRLYWRRCLTPTTVAGWRT